MNADPDPHAWYWFRLILLHYNLLDNHETGVNIFIENDWYNLFDTDPQNGVRSSVAEPVDFWPCVAPGFFVAGYNPSEKKCFEKLNKMNNSTFNQKKAFMGIIYLFFHNGTRKHNIVLNFFAQPLKKTKTLKRGSNGGGCKKKFRRVYFSMILCIF